MQLHAVTRLDADLTGFDAKGYSAYKYGSLRQAQAYARALADYVDRVLPGLASLPVTVTAPGSRAVPIGADLLADGVLAEINLRRADAGIEAAIRAKLWRHSVPAGDYGSQSLESRRAILATERISTNGSQLRGRHVIVVDDLFVTGLSAEVTVQAVQQYDPASLLYLTVAQLDPQAADSPQIEGLLNHALVRDMEALCALIRSERIVVTQRLCKYLMAAEPGDLERFIRSTYGEVLWKVYAAVIADGLCYHPTYAVNFAQLTQAVTGNGLEARAATCGWLP